MRTRERFTNKGTPAAALGPLGVGKGIATKCSTEKHDGHVPLALVIIRKFCFGEEDGREHPPCIRDEPEKSTEEDVPSEHV